MKNINNLKNFNIRYSLLSDSKRKRSYTSSFSSIKGGRPDTINVYDVLEEGMKQGYWDAVTSTPITIGATTYPIGTPIQDIFAALTNDIYVDGGTYDAATTTLTLSDTDGTTPDVTINLSTLRETASVLNDSGNNPLFPIGTEQDVVLQYLLASIFQSSVTNTIVGHRIASHDDGQGNNQDINETVTSLLYNPLTGQVTYTREDGVQDIFTVGLSQVTNTVPGNRIATHDNGIGGIVDVNETITDLTDNPITRTFTYTNEAGVPVTVSYDDTLTALTNLTTGNRIATYTDEDGTPTDVNETITDFADVAPILPLTTKNEIAAYTKEDGTLHNIGESVTTLLEAPTGTFTYTAEDGAQTGFIGTGSVWNNSDGSQATEASTDINYTSGNVGIGTAIVSPLNKLTVSDVSASIKIEDESTGLRYAGINYQTQGGNWFTSNGNNVNSNDFIVSRNPGIDDRFIFGRDYNRFTILNKTDTSKNIVLTAGGNSGINVSIPTHALDVDGQIKLRSYGNDLLLENFGAGFNNILAVNSNQEVVEVNFYDSVQQSVRMSNNYTFNGYRSLSIGTSGNQPTSTGNYYTSVGGFGNAQYSTSNHHLTVFGSLFNAYQSTSVNYLTVIGSSNNAFQAISRNSLTAVGSASNAYQSVSNDYLTALGSVGNADRSVSNDSLTAIGSIGNARQSKSNNGLTTLGGSYNGFLSTSNNNNLFIGAFGAGFRTFVQDNNIFIGNEASAERLQDTGNNLIVASTDITGKSNNRCSNFYYYNVFSS